jgi:lysophospholipase L1-like esterase
MKIISFLPLFLSFISVVSCAGKLTLRKKMPASYIGRFDLSDENRAKCEWPGSAVMINFEGKSISAVISDSGDGGTNKFGGFNNNYILPVVDDVLQKKIRLKSGKHSYILAKNLENKKHSITIFKCTEAFIGTVVFHDFTLPVGGKFLPPPAKKKRFIEFIGDSVTCAYGNEAKNEKEGFAPVTENNYYSYAAITARELNADFAAIAWSGKGVYRNYDCSTNGTILELYDRVLPSSSNKKYNFEERVPQFVVINIGANDFAKPDLAYNKFVKCYEKLIRKVNSNYPATQIILIGTSKNSDWSSKQFELLKKNQK